MTQNESDALIRQAHAGKIYMRELRAQLRWDYRKIYRRMAELGLPYRKPDCRTRPVAKRDFLKLVRAPSHQTAT